MNPLVILGLVRKHFATAAILLAVMVGASLWFAFQYERHRAQALAQERDRLKGELIQAHSQADLNGKAAAITDAAHTKALSITVKAQEVSHAIQSQPGASDPVPPAVAAAWAAGVDGLRERAGCEPSAGPGGAKPAGAVPASC